MAYPSQFASRITALLHPSVHGLEFSQRQVLLWAKFPIDKCAKFSNCWYRSDRPFGTYRGQYVSYPSQFVSCIPPVLWLQLLLWTLLRGSQVPEGLWAVFEVPWEPGQERYLIDFGVRFGSPNQANMCRNPQASLRTHPNPNLRKSPNTHLVVRNQFLC